MKQFFLVCVALFVFVGSVYASENIQNYSPKVPKGYTALWYAERDDGTVVASRGADTLFNPASVVKVATSLWAIDWLGPDFYFTTTFVLRGTRTEQGVLRGDIAVFGGGDPDFHVENAYLVAQALNDMGIREVNGRLLVSEGFWIGWEGEETSDSTPKERALLMGNRLKAAWNSRFWDNETQQAVERLRTRRGITRPYSGVVVRGRVGYYDDSPFDFQDATSFPVTFLYHHSNSLLVTLGRMNRYSNNDIDRLQYMLGTPEELTAYLQGRLSPSVTVDSLSGLGKNRMTPIDVVALIRKFLDVIDAVGIQDGEILPVAGSTRGDAISTLDKNFSSIGEIVACSVVAKTGTLTNPEEAVAVLVGYVRTRECRMIFCIALSPNDAKKNWLPPAREFIAQWVNGIVEKNNTCCESYSRFSYDDAKVAVETIAIPPK